MITQTHQPSREDVEVARMERLLASGERLAFPVSQWRVSRLPCPLQWRGRAGVAPASVTHSLRLALPALPCGRASTSVARNYVASNLGMVFGLGKSEIAGG